MTDTTDQQAVTVAQIDWNGPIAVRPLGGGAPIPATLVAGPDVDGDYRVSFRDQGAHGYLRGLQWFRADGTPCGPTGHRVIQARHRLASVSPASAETLTTLQLKDAVTELLSHRGERPYRILGSGTSLWETWVPAFRAALRYLPAPASPEPVPATNQAGEVDIGIPISVQVADLRRAIAQALQCTPHIQISVGNHGQPVHRIIYDCGDPWEILRAALATQPATSQEGEGDALTRRVSDVMNEDGGCWTACSGCQESDEGYVSEKYYPYSPTFRCQPGGGCSECGGIGVLWQDGAFLASYGPALSEDATPTPPTLSEDAIRKALDNAQSKLGHISIDAMNGDNLAVTLCSHFDDGEGDEDENGWTPAASDGCDATLKAIHEVYVAALALAQVKAS